MKITTPPFLGELKDFIVGVCKDERIPERDKKVLAAMLVYLVSPLDLIPDWVPILGQLDDLVVLALMLDYLFNVLDNKILLSHFPWQMKHFTRVRRFARFIALLTPQRIKNRLWKYQPNIG